MLLSYAPAMYKIMGLYLLVFLSVVLDLISGIRKSRASGIMITHSYGLRKTIDKLSRYFVLLLSCSIMDAAILITGIPEAHSLPLIPYVSFGIALILCLVESYSIWEKDEYKGKYIEAAKVAKEAIKSSDIEEFADKLITRLEEKKIENENKDNSSTINTNSSVGKCDDISA